MAPTPTTTTIEVFRAEAERLERQIKERRETLLADPALRADEARLAYVTLVVAQLETLDSTLPEHSDTVATMDAITIDANKRRAGAQLDLGLPFSKVAKRLGLSLRELAAELGEDYTNVRNWNSRQKMPDDVRAKLADLAKRPKRVRAKPVK